MVLDFGIEISADDFVVQRVAFRDEPGSAWHVIPPLAFHAGLAVAIEHIVGPLFVGGFFGSGIGRTSPPKANSCMGAGR